MKDHEANCIWPAALQLPAGSALLLDEAMLAPGALNDRGLRNMRALASVLDTQTVSQPALSPLRRRGTAF